MNDDLYDVEAEDDFDEELEPEPGEVETTARVGRGRNQPDTETLLLRVLDLVDAARPIPLSASAKINNKEEVVELLQEAINRLPTELRDARWLRKQREEYLAKVKADGEDMVDAARARAAQMVQRTEVAKGREKMQATSIPMPEIEGLEDSSFFDDDRG